MPKKGTQSLRERVASRLGFEVDDPVFGVAWSFVEGDTSAILWGGADAATKRGFEDEVAEGCEGFLAARDEANALDGGATAGKQSRRMRTHAPSTTVETPSPDWKPFYAKPSEAENERARGIAAYYAALAREEPSVVRFREEILGNELLPPDAVGGWVTSVAARYVSPAAYATLRELQSPPKHPEVEMMDLQTTGANLREYTARLRDRGTGEMMTTRLVPPEGLMYDSVVLAGETIEVYEGTTIHRLRRYGDELGKRYGWGREWAMWFILTGIAPPIHPLDALPGFTLLGGPGHPWTTQRQVVTITLEPWVSEDTLVEAYRQIRHDLRGKQGRTSLKTLALFRFIMEGEGVKSRMGGVQWTARMKEWNDLHKDTHPDWLYGDRANFRAAYLETANNIIGNTGITDAFIERTTAIAKAQQERHASDHTSPYHIPNDEGNGQADNPT